MQTKTTIDVTSYLSEWLSTKRLKVLTKMWRKGHIWAVFLRMQIHATTRENGIEISPEIENRATI